MCTVVWQRCGTQTFKNFELATPPELFKSFAGPPSLKKLFLQSGDELSVLVSAISASRTHEDAAFNLRGGFAPW